MLLITNCKSYDAFERSFRKNIHPLSLNAITHDYPEDHQKAFSIFGKKKGNRVRIYPIYRLSKRGSLLFVFHGKIVSSSLDSVAVRGYMTFPLLIWFLYILALLISYAFGGVHMLIRFGVLVVIAILISLLSSTKYRRAVEHCIEAMKDPLEDT